MRRLSWTLAVYTVYRGFLPMTRLICHKMIPFNTLLCLTTNRGITFDIMQTKQNLVTLDFFFFFLTEQKRNDLNLETTP